MLTLNPSQLSVNTLSLSELDTNYHCIIQLLTQPRGVIHQVMLRPDKIKNDLIRLGETPGDEAAGWQYPQNIVILAILGTGKEEHDKTWTVEPLIQEA